MGGLNWGLGGIIDDEDCAVFEARRLIAYKNLYSEYDHD